MANLNRVQCVWSGLTGLPGLSTFYIADAVDTSYIADIAAAFTACSGLFPTGLTVQVGNAGDTIDDETGTLSGSWSGTGVSPVTSSSGEGPHAAGVGARVRWNTAGIVNGRRVQGRTFIVPITASRYQADGTLTTQALDLLEDFAELMLAIDGLSIWSRPFEGSDTQDPRVGSSHEVTGFSLPDQVAVQRSRRV